MAMTSARPEGPAQAHLQGGAGPASRVPTGSANGIALTIFTPTHNRAALLPRLFRSIAQQVLPGTAVEWLVIDDGSSDDTPAQLATFAAERPDLVRHLRVPNGGKHRAINRAAHAARGDWVLIVDSDDLLAVGALADILRTLGHWHPRDHVGVLRGLRRFPARRQGQPHFRVPRNPGSHAEWISTQPGFDTVEVIRRSALLAHPFPEHAGERFMAESWLWHTLDASHEVHFVDRAWVDGFYQEGGLTARSRSVRVEAPLGAMDVYTAIYRSGARWSIRARAAINWWRYRFHARPHHEDGDDQPAVSGWFAPAGWLMHWADSRHPETRSSPEKRVRQDTPKPPTSRHA
jgi:glycosyltransferase involved in cell wall biosynthesis